jgi:NAD(P)-dependent dehydrogenase (short-subunit alcohol dehydrogenase family)
MNGERIMRFNGKVVVVNGGGGGIGRGVAQVFSENGAKTVIADIDNEAGAENEELIKKQGYEAFFVPTDVSKEDSIENMVSKTLAIYGKIDILINNAGISVFGNVFDNSADLWDKVINTNLRGSYLCSKYCAQAMSKQNGGCIINIASTRAFMSEPDTEAYSASKGGIIALTHSMAVSLGKHKIRVNSISPGWVETSQWKKASSVKPSELREIDHLQHPVLRVGTPYDIAHACMFLSSDDAGFITGTNLTVDGGMTIKMIYEE